VNESTATLRTADGLDLKVRRWQADDAPHRWTFVVVHGLGEHSGRYQHLAEWFAPLGATVYAMDQRGHGLSGGPRGHAPSLNALLDDIDVAVMRARSESGGPVVLVGHSFGGLIAIAYTLRHPDHVDRAVFSAPLLIPKVKVPAWKRPLTKVLPRLAPRLAVSNEVDPNLLSHDPEVARRYASDPLVHDRITGGLLGTPSPAVRSSSPERARSAFPFFSCKAATTVSSTPRAASASSRVRPHPNAPSASTPACTTRSSTRSTRRGFFKTSRAG